MSPHPETKPQTRVLTFSVFPPPGAESPSLAAQPARFRAAAGKPIAGRNRHVKRLTGPSQSANWPVLENSPNDLNPGPETPDATTATGWATDTSQSGRLLP